MDKRNLREELAALSHDQWAGWMKYMFSKCELRADGSVVIPPELVSRWQRQMNAPYNLLPGAEKESDRLEADRMISVVDSFEAEHALTGQ